MIMIKSPILLKLGVNGCCITNNTCDNTCDKIFKGQDILSPGRYAHLPFPQKASSSAYTYHTIEGQDIFYFMRDTLIPPLHQTLTTATLKIAKSPILRVINWQALPCQCGKQ